LTRLTRTLAASALIAVVLAVAALAAPAAFAAAPHPAATTDAPVLTDSVVDCIAQFNPVPQKSTSGGTFGTVHWGGKLSCVGDPGSLSSTVKLYTVVGTGDNQHNVPEDTHTLSAIGLTVGNSWFTACLGTTSTRWIASIASTYNGDQFNPYPGWSSVSTLACAA
jgi:hypothetical protein